jgi:hypothetical protein
MCLALPVQMFHSRFHKTTTVVQLLRELNVSIWLQIFNYLSVKQTYKKSWQF